MALAAQTADAPPTKEETLNLLIQNVRARMAEVKEARNDASDLRAAAEAVNALVEHVEPKATPVAETKAEEGQRGAQSSTGQQPAQQPAHSGGDARR